jgi:hypothetical protein
MRSRGSIDFAQRFIGLRAEIGPHGVRVVGDVPAETLVPVLTEFLGS